MCVRAVFLMFRTSADYRSSDLLLFNSFKKTFGPVRGGPLCQEGSTQAMQKAPGAWTTHQRVGPNLPDRPNAEFGCTEICGQSGAFASSQDWLFLIVWYWCLFFFGMVQRSIVTSIWTLRPWFWFHCPNWSVEGPGCLRSKGGRREHHRATFAASHIQGRKTEDLCCQRIGRSRVSGAAATKRGVCSDGCRLLWQQDGHSKLLCGLLEGWTSIPGVWLPKLGENALTYIWSFNPRSISSSQSPLPGWLNRFGSDVDKH